MKDGDIVLPAGIVTKQQFVRFLHDFEAADSELTTVAARNSTGVTASAKAAVSPDVTKFSEQNKLKLTDSAARAKMLAKLRSIKTKAPVVHLTFASEADEASLAKLSTWLREAVHPHALIDVGLQPRLVAGLYMRSINKVFDYSLRSKLEGQRSLLIEALGGTK